MKGPAVATHYWNYGGLMESDQDVLGFFDFNRDGVVSEAGKLSVLSA